MQIQGVKRFGLVAAAALTIVGVTVAGLVGSRPEVCEGVGRDIGGCEPNQPTFSANDCVGVGLEVGQHLDTRVLSIIESDRSSPNSKAVDILHAEMLVAQRANQHLRDLSMVDQCDAETLMESAEQRLSPPFRDKIGAYMYDEGAAQPYSEWRREMLTLLAIVDEEEHLQGPGSTR